MKKNKYIITNIICIVSAIVLLSVTAVFAWISFSKKTQPFIIHTGSLFSTVRLFADNDNNGLIDEEQDTLITNAVYISEKAVPSQSFDYILEVKNSGTVKGFLSINILLSSVDIDSSNLTSKFKLFVGTDVNNLVEKTFTVGLDFELTRNIQITPFYLNEQVQYFFIRLIADEEITNEDFNKGIVIEKITINLDQVINQND